MRRALARLFFHAQRRIKLRRIFGTSLRANEEAVAARLSGALRKLSEVAKVHSVAIVKSSLLCRRKLLQSKRSAFTEWQKYAFRNMLRRNRTAIEQLQSELVVWRTMPVTRDPELYRDPAKVSTDVAKGSKVTEQEAIMEGRAQNGVKVVTGTIVRKGSRLPSRGMQSASTSARTGWKRKQDKITAALEENCPQINRTPSPPAENIQNAGLNKMYRQDEGTSPFIGDSNEIRQRAFAWRLESPHRARERSAHLEVPRVRYGLGSLRSPASSKVSQWQNETISSSNSYGRRQAFANAVTVDQSSSRTSPEVASFIERTSLYYSVQKASPYKRM